MRKPKDPRTAGKKNSAKPESADDSGETKPETSTKPEFKLEPELLGEPEPKPAPEALGEPEAADAPPYNAPPYNAPSHDETPHDDHAHDDHADDEEHGHRSLAATALMALIGVIFIASLTLWAAPKLAPHLPGGVAKYLVPGQIDTEDRLAGLEGAVAAEAAKSAAAIAAVNAGVEALAAGLDAAAEAGQGEAGQRDAAVAAARSAAEAAAAETALLAARLDAIETGLTSLGDELSALSTALADAATGEDATSPEIAAAIAALSARLDNLAETVGDGAASRTRDAALEARIAALATRLDAAEASAADARDVQSEALGEVSSAIRQTRLVAAVDLLASRLSGGLPYGAKLGEVAALAESTPPAALAAGADTGLATVAALEASFGRHAQAAVAADVRASAGEGAGRQALGWLRAQVAGRPVAEIEGDSVGAVTSRIAARVGEGKLAEALTQAEALPEHAQAGLGGWLDRLRARVAADAALAAWRAQIGASG